MTGFLPVSLHESCQIHARILTEFAGFSKLPGMTPAGYLHDLR